MKMLLSLELAFPNTTHGTAIYADQLTPKTTLMQAYIMAVPWSVWDWKWNYSPLFVETMIIRTGPFHPIPGSIRNLLNSESCLNRPLRSLIAG